MSTPEQIQAEIEETRAKMSNDVDRLSDKVTPSKVMGRRVDNVKSSAASLRERVMGSSGDSTGSTGSALGEKKDQLQSAVSDAPGALRQQTQGNPLAVGLIAFGVGWLLSSAAPASQAEQQLAATAESKAKELSEPLKQTGQDIAQNLKAPVQDSVEQVKQTATQAAQDTTDHAKSAAADVKETAQQ